MRFQSQTNITVLLFCSCVAFTECDRYVFAMAVIVWSFLSHYTKWHLQEVQKSLQKEYTNVCISVFHFDPSEGKQKVIMKKSKCKLHRLLCFIFDSVDNFLTYWTMTVVFVLSCLFTAVSNHFHLTQQKFKRAAIVKTGILCQWCDQRVADLVEL